MVTSKLSIVVPVFNKWNFTKSCLDDLGKLPADLHDIIIIDNASSDETKDKMTELSSVNPLIKYVRNEENVFHSKACNQGFRLSTGKHVLFLNNDIRIKANHASWTKTLTDACDATNGLVGPTMGQLDNQLNFLREANQQLTGNSYMGGWCVAAKREVWNKLDVDGTGQIWNEAFPMYFNDTDLSFRARKQKIPMTVVPLPDAVHFGKVSAAQINIRKLYLEGRAVFLKHWSK
jgi:GT2 family glycosyltransferase